ncbi:AAA family ATPase [Mucilaginibacter sp.]|nr:AAA family ATPase [Mucilaginibacter sp.]
MGKTIYMAATEAHSGKSVVAIGLMHTLLGSAQKVAFFKPISSQCQEVPL